ncbi:MAG: alanine racemase [Glaciecola sp.]|jgi:alanine racemase|nr:alanine racemase [Glaciecola sp.]MDG1816650.1 alanine racemase [Glaciecola sp.]MDG2098055.1 alanine racemase [Glaciecola sp.]
MHTNKHVNNEFSGIRSAWVEIDHGQLIKNFTLINADTPSHLKKLCVVKDQAYGHGAVVVAQAAVDAGYDYLAVETIDEAIELREADIALPILIFGEVSDEEFSACVAYKITCCVNDISKAKRFNEYVQQGSAEHTSQAFHPVHIEIDSGMSRWGVRWDEAFSVIEYIANECEHLYLEGLMSHFAMSDEADKTYANLQHSRFVSVLEALEQSDITIPLVHMSNTGGLLDLPHAHFNMIRSGILHLGVYPSLVCKRIDGLAPVMSVKASIPALRQLHEGDCVGYGMHFTASTPMQIAILPIGYGDGYPRVRNEGYVLIHGQQCPVVGGNAMDAMMVDVSHIPDVAIGDEVVLMGGQGDEWIDPRDLVKWKKTVCYEILTGWRARLPRRYVG